MDENDTKTIPLFCFVLFIFCIINFYMQSPNFLGWEIHIPAL